MKSERPAKLDKIRKEAIERISKTEQLQIRLDPELWDALYKLAGQRRQPVSSMVREWITDRLAIETGDSGNLQYQLDLIAQKIDKACERERDTQKLFIAACGQIAKLLHAPEPQVAPPGPAETSASAAVVSEPMPVKIMRQLAQDDEIRAEIDKLLQSSGFEPIRPNMDRT